MRKVLKTAFRIILVSVYFVPSILFYLIRVRFVINSTPGRIGHLAAEFDCYLKEVELGSRPRVTAVVLLPKKVANDCLLQYWEARLPVVRNLVLRKLLKPFLQFPYLRITLLETVVAINETATYPRVLAHWAPRPPLLELTEDHRSMGEQCLRELGIPPNAWFVCVHSRESGYSPDDEYVHAHRNSEIGSYRLAMNTIVERGGWCIRVGDETMSALQPTKGIIDYANSGKKSDWMDIFLCAECRFFLGNSSGLCVVSTVFGVPLALANMTPLSNAYPNGPTDLGIPMLVELQSGGMMSFVEAFNSPVANYRSATQFSVSGLNAVSNDEKEIRDLAVEMMDRLDGVAIYSEEDELRQKQFRELFRPGHFSFNSGARLGRDFLNKYSQLISL